MRTDHPEKSLAEKLGIREGTRIFILDPPQSCRETIDRLSNSRLADFLGDSLDFILYFAENREALENKFPTLKKALSEEGTLWISWRKKTSKVKTDLNENIVREIGLRNGLVDVKVCSIDETWSGLKFVYRLKERKLPH